MTLLLSLSNSTLPPPLPLPLFHLYQIYLYIALFTVVTSKNLLRKGKKGIPRAHTRSRRKTGQGASSLVRAWEYLASCKQQQQPLLKHPPANHPKNTSILTVLATYLPVPLSTSYHLCSYFTSSAVVVYWEQKSLRLQARVYAHGFQLVLSCRPLLASTPHC